MLKSFVFLVLVFGIAGCASLQERLAKRVGCDQTKLVMKNQIHVPAYTEYTFTCEGKDWVCRDAPFYSTCEEDKGKKKDAAATPAADAKDAPAAAATPAPATPAKKASKKKDASKSN